MPYPSHSPLFLHSNYTFGRVEVMKFLIMQFFSNLLPLHPSSAQIFSTPCSHTPLVC
jgi:hypothetical protein